MPKVMFLDRDGVINIDTGYAHRIEEITFVDGILEFIRKLSEDGWRIIVITNQAGIAYGYYDETAFHHLMGWMLEEIVKAGGAIERYYFCPHHVNAKISAYREDCNNRKPSPGMLVQAARELKFELSEAYFIGDSAADQKAAQNAGIKNFFLLEAAKSEELLDTIYAKVSYE